MITLLRRSPLLVVLIPLALFFGVLLNTRAMPIHDTLTHFMRIHTFLNHFAATGHWPLWFPGLDWGSPTSIYFLQAMSPTLLFLAPLLKIFPHWNILSLGYASFFIDNLILLGGTYALCESIFKRTTTAVFVCFLIVGPVVEMEQSLFSFYLFYNLPLCMYFIREGIRRQDKNRLLVGFIAFLVTGAYCTYTSLLQGLCLILFTIITFWELRISPVSLLKNRWSGRNVGTALVLLICLIAPLLLLALTTPVSLSADGRQVGGVTAYHSFLTYGWAPDSEFFTGLLGGEAFTRNLISYGTLFLFPFAIAALVFAPSRKQVSFLAIAGFLFLLWAGPESFMAPLLYHLPGFSLFRHLGHVTSALKIFLVFIAGFGFERWITGLNGTPKRARRFEVTLYLMFAVGVIHFLPFYTEAEPTVRGILIEVVYILSIILAASSLLHLRIRRITPQLLILLVAVDVFSFRSFMYHVRMVDIPPVIYDLFGFRPLAFPRERTINYFDAPEFPDFASITYFRNSNRASLQACLESGMSCPRNQGADPIGAMSSELEPFLGFDPCYSLIRSDMALPKILDVENLYRLPIGFKVTPKLEPLHQPGFLKVAACGNDKFQIADRLKIFRSEDEVKRFMTSAGYRGEVAVVDDRAPAADNYQSSVPVNAGEAFTIRHYDYNGFEGKLQLPNDGKSRWLYVSEAWDPKWHARVNGIDTPIIRANLGFRAIAVPPGMSRIEFAYQAPIVALLILICWGISIIGVAAFLGWLTLSYLIPTAGSAQQTTPLKKPRTVKKRTRKNVAA